MYLERYSLSTHESIGDCSSGNKMLYIYSTANETGERETEYLSSNELYLHQQQRCRTTIIVNCWKWDQMRDSINIYSRLYLVTQKKTKFHVLHLNILIDSDVFLSNWSFPWFEQKSLVFIKQSDFNQDACNVTYTWSYIWQVISGMESGWEKFFNLLGNLHENWDFKGFFGQHITD